MDEQDWTDKSGLSCGCLTAMTNSISVVFYSTVFFVAFFAIVFTADFCTIVFFAADFFPEPSNEAQRSSGWVGF
jgi:hypothetical protein